jgi:3-isopropylmalate/(R)-2-methylmalate dehydratase small subunit
VDEIARRLDRGIPLSLIRPDNEGCIPKLRLPMKFSSRVVPLPHENVDTDQIIPARFLKTTVKEGLGGLLLFDWRYDSAGNPRPECVLNQPALAGAKILLAGNNFGCGSSREHAPWALADFGFRAIISTSFADIFRGNCLKNGILPIVVDTASHEKLFRLADERPGGEIAIDLAAQTLFAQDGEAIEFPIDPFSKKCLLENIDELGYLLMHLDLIIKYEKKIQSDPSSS